MEKLKQLLKSRKFYALLTSLVAIASGYATGGVNVYESLQLVIAAIAAYSVATGIEDSKSI